MIKDMKKLGVVLSGVAFAASAIPAFAQEEITIQVRPEDVRNAVNPSVTIGQVVGFLVGAAVVFGIIAALLFIIIGAFQWITSGGDKGKVESARNHIIAAIIGLVIIVLSLVIMNFVLQILGMGGLGGFKLKTLPKCPPGKTFNEATNTCS